MTCIGGDGFSLCGESTYKYEAALITSFHLAHWDLCPDCVKFHAPTAPLCGPPPEPLSLEERRKLEWRWLDHDRLPQEATPAVMPESVEPEPERVYEGQPINGDETRVQLLLC